MPRQKGTTKTGGRKKGSLNKKTLELSQILKKANINVPEKIIELLPTLDTEKQVEVLLKLMPYLYPKRKPKEPLEVKLESVDINKPIVNICIPKNGRESY